MCMDIKKGRSRGPVVFRESRKKFPIFAKSFRPVGLIQFANTTWEKGMFAEVKEFLPRSAEGLWRRYSLLYTYTCSWVRPGSVKRVSASADGSVGLAATPNRLLCHTDNCKEIIPVNGRPLTRTIWSFVHSVPFASADVAFAAHRHLARILELGATLQNEFLFSSLFPFLSLAVRTSEKIYIDE